MYIDLEKHQLGCKLGVNDRDYSPHIATQCDVLSFDVAKLSQRGPKWLVTVHITLPVGTR